MSGTPWTEDEDKILWGIMQKEHITRANAYRYSKRLNGRSGEGIAQHAGKLLKKGGPPKNNNNTKSTRSSGSSIHKTVAIADVINAKNKEEEDNKSVATEIVEEEPKPSSATRKNWYEKEYELKDFEFLDASTLQQALQQNEEELKKLDSKCTTLDKSIEATQNVLNEMVEEKEECSKEYNLYAFRVKGIKHALQFCEKNIAKIKKMKQFLFNKEEE